MEYNCWRCHKLVEIESGVLGIKCPHCGSKIFEKKRGTISRKVTAR